MLFFLSGFCGLLYQVIWLRLAFRSFGVITPVLSVVISIFMLGLSLGSWAGGKWITSAGKKTGKPAILYYALAELLIGVGAFVVPLCFLLSENFLLKFGGHDSFLYLFLSALLIALSILPWCVLMGATFPLMMAFFKATDRSETTSFSFLYLANVIGAMCGTLITAFILIELIGFKNTLFLGGSINFSIAVISYLLSRSYPFSYHPAEKTVSPSTGPGGGLSVRSGLYTTILFITGFTSLGLEVVWTRAFTPILRTTVYAFAALVAVYLFATWVGSFTYRRDLSKKRYRSNATLLILLALSVFAPIIINDPRVNISKTILLISIFPFCAVLGYLTPKLIDEYSAGAPGRAGRAYAVNIVGSILGPLIASYALLPLFGSKVSMAILGVPYLLLVFLYAGRPALRFAARAAFGSISIVLLLISLLFSIGYEDRFGLADFSHKGVVRRDHTATVISYGAGMEKQLFVNGIAITKLTTITKMMAHLPLTMLSKKPESALVICFGMGTTFRSLMSWPIKATAVELVPSVRDAFSYYYNDAEEIMKDPRGNVVVDDGRRYLRRTKQKFDVITIDPPPPIEAAGSSLLYSYGFYRTVKMRLNDGGILHQWLPGGDEIVQEGVIRALVESFPYVNVYPSFEGWGAHFLASSKPIPNLTVEAALKKIPYKAKKDILEWSPSMSLRDIYGPILSEGRDAHRLLTIFDRTKKGKDILMTDDHPVNEYYILRQFFNKFKL